MEALIGLNRITVPLLVYGCLLSLIWLPGTLWPFPRRWGQQTFRATRLLWVLSLIFAVANLSDRSRWQWPAMFVLMGASVVLAGAYFARAVQCEEGRQRRLWPVLIPLSMMIPLVLSAAATVSIVTAVHEEWERRAGKALAQMCLTMDKPHLHEMLLSHRPQRVLAASAELASRTLVREDMAIVVSAVSDQQLDADTRHRIGFDFFDGKPRSIDSETLPGIARLLYDPDPAIQLSAAWMICEGAIDAPGRFDIWYGGYKEALMEKHDRYVPMVRQWWERRNTISTEPSTVPSGPEATSLP